MIDDELDACLLITRQLKRAGFIAEYSTSLVEGKSVLSSKLYDVLLLDINLKDGNGLTVLEENRVPAHTKVLVLSARKHLENEALEKGADCFLSKPFSMEELQETISQLAQQ